MEMISSFDQKYKQLESVIELQYFKSKDVPGSKKTKRTGAAVSRIRIPILCKNCKSKCECGSLVVKCPNSIVLSV